VTRPLAATDAPEDLGRVLAGLIGEQKYKRWFSGARWHLEGNQLELTVPNRFVGDWIRTHFQAALEQATAPRLGADPQVHVRVDPSSGRARPQATADSTSPKPARSAKPAPQTQGNGFRRDTASLRYDLSDFVVGPSNQLAYTAAVQLADGVEGDFNPLFLHGGCGLGKTHLLQGLCRSFAARHPHARWNYTTAESFTNDYVEAVRRNRLSEFRRKVRQFDLLVVDDVHFLANKKSTQAEFLHTFDSHDLGGARLALASDEHPKHIERLADSLVSRFLRGMVVRVDPPEVDTRQQIIRALARRRKLKLVDSVVDRLAGQAHESIRELEGILTKLGALARLTRGPHQAGEAIGHALLERVMTPEPSARSRRPIRFEQVLERVCNELQVPTADVLARGRHRRVVLARSLAVYLARELTTLSYPELARALGRTNHSTVVTADQRIRRQLRDQVPLPETAGRAGESLSAMVDRLRAGILETASAA